MTTISYDNLNIVALGDSITYSQGRADGWVARLAAECPGATVVNAGIDGETLVQMTERMRGYAPVAGKRNIMIIWGGTNDMVSGSSEYVASDHMAAAVNQARAAGFEAWVVDTLPRSDVSQMEIQSFNSLIAAGSAWDRFIDMYARFTTGLGEPNSALFIDDSPMVHPNSRGDALIASVMEANLAGASGSQLAGAGLPAAVTLFPSQPFLAVPQA